MATTVTLKPNAIDISGSTSGTTTLQATAVAGTTTITLPAATDTLVGKATTDTLTNKTLTSPTLTTPVLGTPSSGTLTNCTGLPNAGLVNSSITIGGTAIALGASSSTITNDLSISGLTVGKGLGAVSSNTAVGASALAANTTGSLNTAIGYQALDANTTGLTNTAVGENALGANTTSSDNTAVGRLAAALNTTGTSLSVLGSGALYANTTGSYNTAIGKDALVSNTTASYNTAVGYQAGLNITTGANNACFGYIAGTDTVRNITTNSNEIVMGNNSHTTAYIKIAWTVTSDARDKTSFAPVPHGLAFVNSLTPTAYQFRVSREDETATGPVRYGFKAQDILAIEGDSPVIIDNSDSENLKYNQDSMIAILVNAIKELKAEIDNLKAQINGA